MNEFRTGSETSGGKGALPENDGRCFMALLDMIHFLVDRITSTHKFANVEEASMLRSTNTRACALLTAEAYSYWYSAPAGQGVFEMLCEWTERNKDHPDGPACFGPSGKARFGAALHTLAIKECAQWARRRRAGKFFYVGDDETGAALLTDERLERVYRVVGLGTSIGDMLRRGPGGFAEVGSVIMLTLLPFMGQIVYDGTLVGGPSLSSTDPSLMGRLRSLAASTQAGGSVIAELPAVAEAPLLRKRVVVAGIRARPELNGRVGFAGSFDDAARRYVVSLEDGGGSFKVKPDNLTMAPPREDTDGLATPLSEREVKLQHCVRALPRRDEDEVWVCRRMGYSEAENPNHLGMIMSSKNGMVLGIFQSKHLAPTSAEYLSALETTFAENSSSTHKGGVGFRPSFLGIDEQSAVARLKAVLGPAGVQVCYYPPPSDEELAAMGVK
jgi:hypothetical protein